MIYRRNGAEEILCVPSSKERMRKGKSNGNNGIYFSYSGNTCYRIVFHY